MSWLSAWIDDQIRSAGNTTGDENKPKPPVIGDFGEGGAPPIGGGDDASGTSGPTGQGTGVIVPGGFFSKKPGSIVKIHGRQKIAVQIAPGVFRYFSVRKVGSGPNKGKYILSRPPQMNPFNPHALRRAMCRTRKFSKFARRVLRTEHHFKPAFARKKSRTR